jgi:serine/threonine-protein kinase
MGSRQFVLDLYVGWTGGVPIKLDNGGFNVISNVHMGTVPVPNVVGMNEATAVNLLKSSLNPMTVRRVFNPAPAGTVFAQNPAGGTVAPLGSEVDLSVSVGPAAVPDLLYWPATDAVVQITAHGFVLGQVTPVINCEWPGWVIQQNPPGGTLAPPGTAINIGIGAC